MAPLWIPYGPSKDLLWTPYGPPMPPYGPCLWTPYGLPMDSLWTLMDLLWPPYDHGTRTARATRNTQFPWGVPDVPTRGCHWCPRDGVIYREEKGRRERDERERERERGEGLPHHPAGISVNGATSRDAHGN